MIYCDSTRGSSSWNNYSAEAFWRNRVSWAVGALFPWKYTAPALDPRRFFTPRYFKRSCRIQVVVSIDLHRADNYLPFRHSRDYLPPPSPPPSSRAIYPWNFFSFLPSRSCLLKKPFIVSFYLRILEGIFFFPWRLFVLPLISFYPWREIFHSPRAFNFLLALFVFIECFAPEGKWVIKNFNIYYWEINRVRRSGNRGRSYSRGE